MRELQLTRGLVSLIDDVDFERCLKFRWYPVKRVHTTYASRVIKYPHRTTSQLLHNFILNASGIDHIDGNGLNNQRSNLRLATPMQNRRNTHRRSTFTSRYKGVSWNAKDRVWRAFIYVNYKQIYLGRFRDEVEAAKAYDQAALELFGEFASTNFGDGA
jgi:hypothetical protein